MEDTTMPNKTVNYFSVQDFKLVDQKGRDFKLAQIPLAIDIRAGQRDFGYLLQEQTITPSLAKKIGTSIDEVISKVLVPDAVDDEGKPIKLVRFNVPFLLFPKGFFGDERCESLGITPDPNLVDTHNMLQGNTREMLLRTLINQNKEASNQARIDGSPEALAKYEENKWHFDIVKYEVLTEAEATSSLYVRWAQTSTNDGTRGHTTSQMLKQSVSFLKLLRETYPDRPLAELIEKTAKTLGVGSSRIYHFTKADKSFPEWLISAIDAAKLTFDTSIVLYDTHSKLVKEGAYTGTLTDFFLACWERASSGQEAGAMVKIVASHITQLKTELLNAANKSEKDLSDDGDDSLDEGVELPTDPANSSDSTPASKSEDELEGLDAASLLGILNETIYPLGEELVSLTSIQPDYFPLSDLKAIVKMAKALNEKIKSVEAKKQERDAKAMAKEAQKLQDEKELRAFKLEQEAKEKEVAAAVAG